MALPTLYRPKTPTQTATGPKLHRKSSPSRRQGRLLRQTRSIDVGLTTLPTCADGMMLDSGLPVEQWVGSCRAFNPQQRSAHLAQESIASWFSVGKLFTAFIWRRPSPAVKTQSLSPTATLRAATRKAP